MAASAAALTGLPRGLLSSEDEFGLIDKLREHKSYCDSEGYKNKYFLNKFHLFFNYLSA